MGRPRAANEPSVRTELSERQREVLGLIADGRTNSEMLGTFVLWLTRPPVDPGPHYPPEANTTRDMKVALDFPFDGVLGEWSWENWCAEPMSWVFWQAKAPGGSGPQVALINDFWPPCISPGGPSTLNQQRMYAGLEGDVTPDSACLRSGFEAWLCEFATSVAIDGVAGRSGLFPKRISNDAFFLCDGFGSAPGLGDSEICKGEPANTSVRGYWLESRGDTGRFVSEPDLEAAVGAALPSSAALGAIACAAPPDGCSRFVIGLGPPSGPSVALIFHLEGGQDPKVIGAVIAPGAVIESPFGAFEPVPLSPRE